MICVQTAEENYIYVDIIPYHFLGFGPKPLRWEDKKDFPPSEDFWSSTGFLNLESVLEFLISMNRNEESGKTNLELI